jgi:DNA-binding CsgD family transcriptional regulator
MSTPVKEGFWALTEKEKQTLRLIVRGHDAKSTARSLGLSVHTINERLRDARRKLAVSSSREAARMLLEAECADPGAQNPDLFGDMGFREDAIHPSKDQGSTPTDGAGRAHRHSWIIIGVLLMTFGLGLLTLIALPQIGSAPPLPMPVASTNSVNPEVLDTARRWLVLGDEGRWDESYQATGRSFRKLNSLQRWAAVAEKVRTPLGAVLSRTFVSEENLPAPPYGYEVVKFRTSFANKADALETVSLDREKGAWRVVGITID